MINGRTRKNAVTELVFAVMGLLMFSLIIDGPRLAYGAPIAAGATLIPRQEPTSGDWQVFKHLTPERRAALWQDMSKQAPTLSAWSWQWRLGWVSSCEGDREKSSYCQKIFQQGLIDSALVVRSTTATAIGRTYAGTADDSAIDMLAGSYARSHNFRHTKPLFISERILFALKEIGGDRAKKVAGDLATKHATSKKYWQRINRAG